MDEKTYLGNIGESKAIFEFTKLGYDIFVQAFGKAPFDLVLYKDGDIKKVQVKTTSYKPNVSSYEVQLRSVRSNKVKNKIKKFDSSLCDILFIYFEPIDKFRILDSTLYEGRSTINFKEEELLGE